MVAGDDPVATLATAVTSTARRAGLSWSLRRVRRKLRHDNGLRELAEELLADGAQPGHTSLLVPIDQREELFARTTDPAGRAGRLPHAAIAGPVRVVLPLRSEFLDDLGELPGLGAGSIDTYLLGSLGHGHAPSRH